MDYYLCYNVIILWEFMHFCRIWGFHSSDYEEYHLLGCDVWVYYKLMFWRNVRWVERLPWLTEAKTNILFILLGWRSTSMQSMYGVLVVMMEVSWNITWCLESMLYSAMADLSWCSSQTCHWWSFNLEFQNGLPTLS